MRRRALLHATATALTAGLAGCGDDGTATPTATTNGTGTVTRSATETPTPETAAVLAPIEELWTAYSDGSADGVLDAFHPDAPDRPDASTLTLEGTVTVDDTEVVAQSSDEATVQTTLTRADESGTETQEHSYELRRYDGEWRVWSIETESTDSSGSDAPQVSFAFEYDTTGTTGAETGVLTVTHEGGDNVDAEHLSIRGDGITTVEGAQPSVVVSGVDWATATGVDTVAAGDDVTVGTSSDCEIRVVWTAAGGETSATLAQYDGPAA